MSKLVKAVELLGGIKCFYARRPRTKRAGRLTSTSEMEQFHLLGEFPWWLPLTGAST